MPNYTFQLDDLEFCNFAESVGVLFVAGEEYSRRWAFTRDFSKGETDFMADHYFQFAISGYQFTPAEMAFHWRVMCDARDKLQAVWDKYIERFIEGLS